MAWRDVAFLHWPVPPAAVRGLVPEPLALDTHGGHAWISLVALRIEGFRLGPLPFASQEFAALNVRTYVTHEGVAGLWFLECAATDRWFCAAARRMGIPYRPAHVTMGAGGVRSEPDAGGPPTVAAWSAGARPPDPALDRFLVERYASFSRVGDRLLRADVEHAPWRLDAANARVLGWGAMPVAVAGMQPELAHTSEGVEVTMRRAQLVAKVP